MTFRLPITLALLISTNLIFAEGMKQYEVSVTNITKGQTFTPLLVATHSDAASLFTLGQPASDSLALLAEAGNTDALTAEILNFPNEIGHVKTIPGLLGPGETVSFEIKGHHKHYMLTVAAMLLPSNDTFIALSSAGLPNKGSASYMARAYDAGTEANDQLCIHIPGPLCGGEADSATSDTDEGYVYVSNGIHDLGDLDPATYGWHNPIALITIKAMHKNEGKKQETHKH